MSGPCYKAFYVVDATAVQAKLFIQGTLTEVEASVWLTSLYQYRSASIQCCKHYLLPCKTSYSNEKVNRTNVWKYGWSLPKYLAGTNTLAYVAFSLMTKETKTSKNVFLRYLFSGVISYSVFSKLSLHCQV